MVGVEDTRWPGHLDEKVMGLLEEGWGHAPRTREYITGSFHLLNRGQSEHLNR